MKRIILTGKTVSIKVSFISRILIWPCSHDQNNGIYMVYIHLTSKDIQLIIRHWATPHKTHRKTCFLINYFRELTLLYCFLFMQFIKCCHFFKQKKVWKQIKSGLENLIKIYGSVRTHLFFTMLILSNVFLQYDWPMMQNYHNRGIVCVPMFWSLNGNAIPVICLQIFSRLFLHGNFFF